jgi:hypothetical protein
MAPRIFFQNNFDLSVKNTEFNADFESVEKVMKFRQRVHESVGIMHFFTFQYCAQKFSAL